MDNHESHISLAAIDLAKKMGVVLLTIPPRAIHRLQPLDKSVYGPLKAAYNRALDQWMRENPGKVVNIYHIPALAAEAQLISITQANILSGFRSTGINPINQDIFSEADYAPSQPTDMSEEQETAQKGAVSRRRRPAG